MHICSEHRPSSVHAWVQSCGSPQMPLPGQARLPWHIQPGWQDAPILTRHWPLSQMTVEPNWQQSASWVQEANVEQHAPSSQTSARQQSPPPEHSWPSLPQQCVPAHSSLSAQPKQSTPSRPQWLLLSSMKQVFPAQHPSQVAAHCSPPPPQPVVRQISPPVPHCVELCCAGWMHLPCLPVQQPVGHFFLQGFFFFFFFASMAESPVTPPAAARAAPTSVRRERERARKRSSNWWPSMGMSPEQGGPAPIR